MGFWCRNGLAYTSSDLEWVVRPLSRLRIILGHLGEGLPFPLLRAGHRLRHMSAEVRGRQLRPVTFYFRENFYLTTAGHFRTQALIDALIEIGRIGSCFRSTILMKQCRSRQTGLIVCRSARAIAARSVG
jgi:hypothetical protein